MKWHFIKKATCSLLACSLALSQCLDFNILANNASIYEASEKISPSEKISSELYQSMSSRSSSVPVVIWYRSYTQEYIEELIEDEIGYTIDEIEEMYEPPSEELITALNAAKNSVVSTIDKSSDLSSTDKSSVDNYLSLLMKSHMEMTASSREIEKKKTELYKKERHEIVSELYANAADKVLSEMEIPEESTIFISQYTPLIVCNISPEEVIQLSEREDVENLYHYEDFIEPSDELATAAEDTTVLPTNMPLVSSAMGIDEARATLGLNGEGTIVGIYETQNVSLQDTSYASVNGLDLNKVTIIGSYYAPEGEHPALCAAIAAGSYGVAPEADVYSTSSIRSNSSETWLSKLQSLASSGVDVINSSWGGHVDSTDSAVYMEKHIDSLIKNTKTTIVFAAGNNSNVNILTCALSYNAITATAFDPSNSVLKDYSYLSSDDRSKPDVAVADAYRGTSTSAPVLTGMIALLYQYKPCLSQMPHVTKAIVLASCQRKIQKIQTTTSIVNLNETMEDGITERQGAGVPDLYNMISIVAQHSYGYGTVNTSSAVYHDTRFIQPKYGATNINVSMAYLQNGIVNGTPQTLENYDMTLTPTGSTSMTSDLSNSSTELIYTSMTSSDDAYTLRVYKKSGSAANVEFGYAWCTDNSSFYPTKEEEGVYFLKNYNSGLYLNADSTVTKQYAYSNVLDSKWLFKYSSTNGKYTLQSANGLTKGLSVGTSLGTNGYLALNTNSALSPNVILCPNSDGTITFKTTISGTTYALGISNNATSSGTIGVWAPYSESNNSQKWYVQTAAYKHGDVYMNGDITDQDASRVLAISAAAGAGNNTYTNIEMFLADYDGDETVNSVDAALILQNLT